MTLLERVEAMLLNDAIHPTHEHNDLTTYISTGATTVAVARVAFADNRGNENRLPIIAGVC